MRYIYYILVLILVTSCGIKLGRNDRVKRNLPSVSMQNFLYTYTTESGFREWEIKSAQASIFEDKDTIFLYNFTMTFFTKSNEIRTVLVANQGTVQQTLGNMVAEGEVRVFSSNHSELLTEMMYWDQKREIFYSETNKLVTFVRPSQKILGYDMISDSLLENVILNNSVGQLQSKKNNDDSSTNTTKSDIKNFENTFVKMTE